MKYSLQTRVHLSIKKQEKGHMPPVSHSILLVCAVVVLPLLFGLTGCGGGGGGDGSKNQSPTQVTYSVGGRVSGLTSTGLVLQNNGVDNLPVSSDGDFTFTNRLAPNADYGVSIATQPAGQSCSVADGIGTINNANITTVQIDCVTTPPQLWLSANNGVTGFELYRSDGTTTGTILIKDINLSGNSNPGNLDVINGGYFFAVLNGEGYFTAADGIHGTELWKSDGSALGTVLVKDINTGPNSSNPRSPVVMDGALYFFATDATHGAELWRSDGTETGTVLVKDINTGINGSNSFSLIVKGNSLYFDADTSATGRELWKSNGTDIGTVLLKNINPGPADSNPGNFIAMGNSFYFSAYDASSGFELWASDGTSTGTRLLKDISPGAVFDRAGNRIINSGYPGYLTVVGDIFYFTANNVPPTTTLIIANGTQVWKSDGTTVGTVMLKDLRPPATGGGSYPGNLTAVGNTLYFTGFDEINGTELWKSNGTVASTVLVKDINPGIPESFPGSLTTVGNTLYFTADNGTTGNELWKSDGTEPGTLLVKDITPGVPGTNFKYPQPLIAVDNTLYFIANDGTMGFELWKSDGTEANTINVIDLIPGSMNGLNGILKP